MKATDVLTLLAREVRAKTLRRLEPAEPGQMLWAPPGTQNQVAWHAGHILWVIDALCIELVTGRSELPSGWADTFGMNCRPPAQTKAWPDKTELVSHLTDQLPRVEQVLAGVTDEQLERQIPRAGGSTVGRLIVHGFHDEANHQGEIYLLLKMQRPAQS